ALNHVTCKPMALSTSFPRWSSGRDAWLLPAGVALGAVAVVLLRRWQNSWRFVGRRSDFTEGPCGWEILPFDSEGHEACVLHRNGQWLAFNRSCPHAGIDLIVGGDIEDLSELDAGVVIACPAHTYLFDPIHGTCLWDATRGLPETPPLQTYEVYERCARIWVRPREKPKPVSKEDWDQVPENRSSGPRIKILSGLEQMHFNLRLLTKRWPESSPIDA
ncbi:Rieske (2Fe-2S) protein, partial [Durusdinium trenchii]